MEVRQENDQLDACCAESFNIWHRYTLMPDQARDQREPEHRFRHEETLQTVEHGGWRGSK